MNFLEKIYLGIVTSNDQEFVNKIEILKEEVKTVNKQYNDLFKEKNELEKLNDTLYITLDKQLKELQDKNKHNSLEMFQFWMEENIKPVKKRYNYDGLGSKNVCTIFSRSLKHKELIKDFTKNDLGFDGSKYKTADKLMYYFNSMFEDKFPVKLFYEFDINNYNKKEYWATVDKIINKVRTKKRKADDCDGFMTLKYCMLYYLLEEYFPYDLWRLRGFIVDIRNSGGHAMLGWVKGGEINDWVPIETTFYMSNFKSDWNANYRMRDQMLYKIRYSFDNKNAYVKI